MPHSTCLTPGSTCLTPPPQSPARSRPAARPTSLNQYLPTLPSRAATARYAKDSPCAARGGVEGCDGPARVDPTAAPQRQLHRGSGPRRWARRAVERGDGSGPVAAGEAEPRGQPGAPGGTVLPAASEGGGRLSLAPPRRHSVMQPRRSPLAPPINARRGIEPPSSHRGHGGLLMRSAKGSTWFCERIAKPRARAGGHLLYDMLVLV